MQIVLRARGGHSKEFDMMMKSVVILDSKIVVLKSQ